MIDHSQHVTSLLPLGRFPTGGPTYYFGIFCMKILKIRPMRVELGGGGRRQPIILAFVA